MTKTLLRNFYNRLWNEIFVYQVKYNSYREEFWKLNPIEQFNSFDLRIFLAKCIDFVNQNIVSEEFSETMLEYSDDEHSDRCIIENLEIEKKYKLKIDILFKNIENIAKIYLSFKKDINENNYKIFLMLASLSGMVTDVRVHSNHLDYLYPKTESEYRKFHIEDPLYDSFPLRLCPDDAEYIRNWISEDMVMDARIEADYYSVKLNIPIDEEEKNKFLAQEENKLFDEIIKLKNQEKKYDFSELNLENLFETDDFSKEMHEKWASFVEYSGSEKLFDYEIISRDNNLYAIVKYDIKLSERKKSIIGKFSTIPYKQVANIWKLHQYKIGLQLNNLYESIPILMFTYGYPDCKINVSGETFAKPVISQYAGEDNVTLEDFLESKDDKIYSKMRFIDKIYFTFFCMIENLKLLHDEIGFLHRDLNPTNVLIKKFSTEREFPMKWGNENYLFRSDIMPFIIDYEFSSTKKDVTKESSVRNISYRFLSTLDYEIYPGYDDNWHEEIFLFINRIRFSLISTQDRDEEIEDMEKFFNKIVMIYLFNEIFELNSVEYRIMKGYLQYFMRLPQTSTLPVQRNYYGKEMREFYLNMNNWPDGMKKYFDSKVKEKK